jgi:type III pantothenate kinase
MIAAIDIGNTTTKFAFFEEKEPIFRLDAPSDTNFDVDDYWRLVQENLAPTMSIEGVIICSVVPSLTPVLSKVSVEKFGTEPIIFDWSAPIGLVNRYHPPKDVGADRLANAFAAWKTYGADVIIVDIGTAVTLDVVSQDGEYLGGVIAPGVDMGAEALNQKTALLPGVEVEPVESVLGSDTVSAIRSGLTHGYAAMITGLIAKLKQEQGLTQGTRILLTGGHSEIFQNLLSDLAVVVDPDLTLKGLNLIYWELATKADTD